MFPKMSNTIRPINHQAINRLKQLSKAIWGTEMVKRVIKSAQLNREFKTLLLQAIQHRLILSQARQHRWGILVLQGIQLDLSLEYLRVLVVEPATALASIINSTIAIRHKPMLIQITITLFKLVAIKTQWTQLAIIKQALTIQLFYHIRTIRTMLTTQVKGATIQAQGTEVRDGYHLERNKVWRAQTWRMECLFESIELLIDKNETRVIYATISLGVD